MLRKRGDTDMGDLDAIGQKLKGKMQKMKGNYHSNTGDPVRGTIEKIKGTVNDAASDIRLNSRRRHRNGI